MPLSSLLRHPVSIVGALITTAAAVVFLTMAVAAAAGLFNNPYAGLVIFVALPAIFLFGLLLMPLGHWLTQRKLRRDPAAVAEWPVLDFRIPSVRRTALVITALTAVNVTILLLAGYGSLRWMESPSFCGQTCHTPMRPQFSAWQQTTHSRVDCVQCHIGEGARAFVRYKLAGVRQLVHVVGNNYPRPIPASMAELRPALEVCGHCHDPRNDFGERLRVSREYADDEANSETLTVLRMHVGGPGQPTSSGRAIHWHADPSVKIEYVATDPDRQTIPYVRVTRGDGRVTEYTADATKPAERPAGMVRVMDCIDCHNTAAHRIAPTAEQAVDRAIANGLGRSTAAIRAEGGGSSGQQPPCRRERGAASHRAGTTTVLHVTRLGSGSACSCHHHRRSQRRLSTQCLSRHEGRIRGVPRQPRAHHVERLLPVSRRFTYGPGRVDDQRKLRVLPYPGREPRSERDIECCSRQMTGERVRFTGPRVAIRHANHTAQRTH